MARRWLTLVRGGLALGLLALVVTAAFLLVTRVRVALAEPSASSLYLPLVVRFAAPGECLTSEEQALARLINEYRVEHGLPQIPVSYWLTTVSQWHVLDLAEYHPDTATDARGRECNSHSWSANGSWTPVCYTSNDDAPLMWSKPREISSGDYASYGYEIAYRSSGAASAEGAFRAWTNDANHDDVILERNLWQGREWPAMGIGMRDGYAVVWFGDQADTSTAVAACQ